MEQNTPSKTGDEGPFSPQSGKSTGRGKTTSRGRRGSAGPLSSLPSNVQSDLPAPEDGGEEVAQTAPAKRRATRSSGAAAPSPAPTGSALPTLDEGDEGAGASAPPSGARRGRGAAARRAGGGGGGGGAPSGGGDSGMDIDGAPRGGGGSSYGTEDAGEQKFIWGSKFRTSDMQSRVRRFLATYYDPARDAAAAAAGVGRGQPTYAQLLREMVLDGRFGLNVDMADVYACDRLLYQVTVDYPTDMILLWDEEATAAAVEIAGELGDEAPPMEEAVQVRPFNLRADQTRAIRDLDPLHLDTLVAVKGMVTRTGGVIPDLRVADFRCDACHGEAAVRAGLGRRRTAQH
ncbi:hypothetical protein Rsub_07180 [Raphidocelis subcapitata]|uniref:Uncharacterized protein n=1 Tax=Raphidocelis subcapitata TaxID=307507 RepID=A0A2V0P3C6_9CHLO|nr:hypothetical protein Rsub_07180 [Raphidocelis subcapitata]|eukprot:GBF94366.1 hypothetical protein Rsub_07180 [Raphidocelis subcapitata]